MTDTKNDDQLLKTDVLGRVHTPKARQETLLDKFEKSGTSGMAFARLVGVNYQTFAGWVQKRKRRRKQYPTLPKASGKSVPGVQWLEVTLDESASRHDSQTQNRMSLHRHFHAERVREGPGRATEGRYFGLGLNHECLTRKARR
jgi:hypothetical protein